MVATAHIDKITTATSTVFTDTLELTVQYTVLADGTKHSVVVDTDPEGSGPTILSDIEGACGEEFE